MATLTTPARADASRRNGRRGRGPTTVEGKARSSHNSVRHGILTEGLCAGEVPTQREAFSALLDQLRAELAPSSLLEALLVERIAAGLWRTRRVLAFEAGTALERDTTREPDVVRLLRDIEGGPSDPEGYERGLALARALAPANAVDLAIRYEAHLTRELSRLLSQLDRLAGCPRSTGPAVTPSEHAKSMTSAALGTEQ
jgi:hypothetical protein